MMDAILTLLAGTFYGLIIGLIPSAGATTALGRSPMVKP